MKTGAEGTSDLLVNGFKGTKHVKNQLREGDRMANRVGQFLNMCEETVGEGNIVRGHCNGTVKFKPSESQTSGVSTQSSNNLQGGLRTG